MWSLCLTTADRRRQIVKIAATATVAELLVQAEAAFGGEIAEVKGGVPPRPLTASAATSLAGAGVQNQDRIIVTFATAAAASKTKEKSNNKKSSDDTKKNKWSPGKRKRNNDHSDQDDFVLDMESNRNDASVSGDAERDADASPPTRRRTTTTRRAAQRATDSFAVTMAAQDALARKEQQPRSSKSTIRKAVTSTSSVSNKKRPPPRQFTNTTGRRLQDGATIVSPKKNKQRRVANGKSTSHEQDPSLALLETLESKSKAGGLLRKGYKKAVENAYEQNRAVARLAAIPHGIQKLERISNGTVDNENNDETTTGILKVRFAKGVQGRGYFEEEVDYLPLAVLKNVISSIYPVNCEALRPENLALLSPRVLWSIAYHCRNETIAIALSQLFPDLEWTFLQRRKQELSAKARENLRQAQEASATQQHQQQQQNDWEAAAAAIASVEEAMENLHTLEQGQRRARILHAVEERNTWKVVTPDETDEDELKACLDQGPVWENLSSCSQEDLVQRLIRDCSIRNWRELANAQVDNLMIRLGLVLADAPESDQQDVRSHVQAWLEKAQMESLDEIMVEICDGRIDAVEALSDSARSATPKDLSNWIYIVDELRTELLTGLYRQKEEDCPTLGELEKWCQRAEVCMQQLVWTSAFVTPIG